MSTNQVSAEIVSCDQPKQRCRSPRSQNAVPRFKDATRIQESFTSALERRVLLWLAARVPAQFSPDHLTLLGFGAMLMAGASYALARRNAIGLLLGAFFLGMNWFGDSLDGTLARVRNRQRPRYGFYVDHMIDSFGALFLIAGLAVSGYMRWRIAFAMLIAFFLLSIESYLAAYALGKFRLSFGRFGPTEIRILLAAGSIVLWFNPQASVPGINWRLFDFGGLVAAAGMAAMVMIAAAWHTVTLYTQETLS